MTEQIEFGELNNQQKEAVNCSEGNKLILAGAGSGKTKVLTCRVAKLIQDFNIKHWAIIKIKVLIKNRNKNKKKKKENMNTYGIVRNVLLRTETGSKNVKGAEQEGQQYSKTKIQPKNYSRVF